MRDKKKRERISNRREREMEKRSCSVRGRKWDWTGERDHKRGELEAEEATHTAHSGPVGS